MACKKINLSHNWIDALNSDDFSCLFNLQKIDISHNHITTIDQNVFKDLHDLRSLNLSNNELKDKYQLLCLNKCKRIENLDISNNMIGVHEERQN